MDDNETDYKLVQAELKKAMDGLRKFEGKSQGPPYCSFCRRGKGQYLCCVEGNSNVRICDRCVMEAYEIILSELKSE